MNKYQKLLKFYQALADMFKADSRIIDSDALDYPSINRAVEAWRETEGSSFTKFTRKFACDSIYDRAQGGEGRYSDAQNAFRDLAPHLRDPEARRILKEVFEALGFSQENLFVWQRSIRLLSKRGNGPAVVTLLVNDYQAFEDLLSSESVEDSVVKHVLLTNLPTEWPTE